MNRITLFATAAALALSIALPTWAQAPAVSKADSDLNAAWQQMAVANYAPGFQAALMAWRQEQVSKVAAEVKDAQARLTEAQKANAALTQQVAALTKQLATPHIPPCMLSSPPPHPMSTPAPGSR
jgi:hypothetical protein